jgi:dolichol-phosphate mannosyltransferase
MANILYRTRISDLCTGYWGFKGEVIPKLCLSAEGLNFEAELFTQIVKNGYSIGELPIYYRRPTPAKLSSIKDGLRIGWTLMIGRF